MIHGVMVVGIGAEFRGILFPRAEARELRSGDAGGIGPFAQAGDDAFGQQGPTAQRGVDVIVHEFPSDAPARTVRAVEVCRSHNCAPGNAAASRMAACCGLVARHGMESQSRARSNSRWASLVWPREKNAPAPEVRAGVLGSEG